MLKSMINPDLSGKKTNLLTGFIVIMIMLWSANLFADNYLVSGAGTSAVNGTYVENGTNEGKPRYEYTNGGTTYYLAFTTLLGPDYWVITSENEDLEDSGDSEYYISSNSDTPPSSGWQDNNGATPEPTVTKLYSGGSGTSGDPYQIATTDDLIELSNTSDDWDKHFIQTDDITFDATEANVDWNGNGSNGPAEGFSPIGEDDNNPFTGSYDGDGHTISNLYIDRPSTNYVGLFGYTYGSLKKIQNLELLEVNITGGEYYVGGLVGLNGSTVSNVYSTGSVTGEDYVGGLVGRNGGTVENSYSTGSVTGNLAVGGLVGQHYAEYAILKNSYSTGSVTGNLAVGGLVGYNYNGTVSNSYSTGSVTAVNYGGGLVGYNRTTVSNSYSLGDVTRASGSNTNFGGFCGYNDGSTIEYCYSTGDVYYGEIDESGSDPTNSPDDDDPTNKGFVGSETGTNTYTANFFDSEASNQSTGDGATAEDTDAMTNATTTDNIYLNSGWDFKGESANGEEDIWNIGNSRNNGYPYFDWQYPTDDPTLPVTLSTFTALYMEGATQLTWETQTEENNEGWNIYRNSEEDFTTAEKVNNELIPGNGTTTEPSYYNFADESELEIEKTYYYWLESIDLGGENHIYNAVAEITIPEPGTNPNLELPTVYKIKTAPNPMRATTSFRLSLDKTARIEIEIYNIRGKLVKRLPTMIVEADTEQEFYWNGKDKNNKENSSGIYFYKVRANGKTIENSKLIIMK